MPIVSLGANRRSRGIVGIATLALAAPLLVAPEATAQVSSEGQGVGSPAVEVQDPTETSPVVTAPGEVTQVTFESSRAWPYTVELRGPEQHWVPFEDASGVATTGANTVDVGVPDALSWDLHDIRVRLFAPGQGRENTRAADVAANALQVGPAEPPATGFEQRDGDGWTSLSEELDFLEEVAAASPRVEYTEIGESHEGRPLHLVRVGAPRPPTDEAIADGSSVLVIGAQHGNEPAGREMSLQLLRDLAFTDDETLTEQLGDTTMLFVPTANPDGVTRSQRANAVGVDLNRDHLNLREPETRALAHVLSSFRPDISIDAHETSRNPQNPDTDTYMLIAWQRNLNVHPDVYDLNVEMVDDYLFPGLDEAGYEEVAHFGSPDDGQDSPEFASQVFGMRHGLGLLTESYMHGPPQARIDVHMDTMDAILRFQRDRWEAVADATTRAPVEKAAQGAEATEPFYLRGADWDTQPVPSEFVLDPPPCGYLLNTQQAEQIAAQEELFPLELERVSDEGVFITMGQPMMTLLPDLADERGRSNEVAGEPLFDCSDPGSLEPPPPPPPDTPPSQHAVDFTDDQVGEPPEGWTSWWNDSTFTVLDDPRRLRHDVQDRPDGDGRQSLVLDAVGDDGVVRGDVEISALVRGSGNATVFQLGLHISGDAPDEANAFYVDARLDGTGTNANHVRIGRHRAGAFTLLNRAPVPFTVKEDTWYRVVLQREGEMLRAKLWPDGEEEPDDWQVIARDESFTEGRVGVMHFTAGTEIDWAFIGLGTGGEPAPRAPEN